MFKLLLIIITPKRARPKFDSGPFYHFFDDLQVHLLNWIVNLRLHFHQNKPR